MWLQTLSLFSLIIHEVTASFNQPFTDVLNYHKSVHLFYQDWLDNSYGKVNFTDKQKAYYNSLAPHTSFRYTQGISPEIKILSLTNSNQDVGSMWSQIMSMFDGLHTGLLNYMDRYPRRYRRDTGSKAQLRKQRQQMRKKLREKGGAVWRRYILQQRLNRLQRGKGDWSPEIRQKKIKMLTKLIQRIDKKHPELTDPDVAGPPATMKYDEPPTKPPQVAAPPPNDVKAPPPPVFKEKEIKEAIPTQKPNDDVIPGAPAVPPTQAPPVNKPVAAHQPNPADTEVHDDFDPFNVPDEDFTGHFPDRKELDDIFRKRKKRHITSQLQYTSKQLSEFRAALERMMTTRDMNGLSQYEIFVKSHRLLQSPQAYSQKNSYMWNKYFIQKFESALHQYNPSVQIPYLDLCGLLQQPDFDKISLWSEFLKKPVIPDCAWIGHTLKRKVVLSDVIINRLNTTLGCTRGSTTQLGMDQYADIHSLFGPCESGGSHLACPSCAVSDPIFWIIYADIDRRIGAMPH